MTNDNTARDIQPDLLIQPYNDAELDAAMREREAIENAEQDLRALRSLWAKRMLATLAGCLSLLMSSAALADGPAKVKRPVMCMSGAPVPGPYFMCTDGKRPRLLLPYIEVQFTDAEGHDASYVLGWPATNKKPLPLPKRLPKDEAPKRVSTVKL